MENSIKKNRYDVEIDPKNNRVYVIIDSKLYLTTDLGNTWNTIFEKSLLEDIEVNPFRTNNIVIANHQTYYDQNYELYTSTDFGNNWNITDSITYAMPSKPFTVLFSSIVPGLSIINWNMSNSDITKSRVSYNNGINWEDVLIPLGYTSYSNIFINPKNYSDLYLYASAEDSSGIYISNDFGKTWNILSIQLSYFRAPEQIYEENDTIALVYENFGSELFKSKDFGMSWNSIGKMGDNLIYSNGKKLYAGPINGQLSIYERDTIWTLINKNIKHLIANNFLIYNNKKYFIRGDYIFEKNLMDTSNDWKLLNIRSQGLLFYNNDIWFCLVYDGFYQNIIKTTDAGKSWNSFYTLDNYSRISDMKIINDSLFIAVKEQDTWNSKVNILSSAVSNPSFSKRWGSKMEKIMFDGLNFYNCFYDSINILSKSSNSGKTWITLDTLDNYFFYTLFASINKPIGVLIGGQWFDSNIGVYHGILYLIKSDNSVSKIYENNSGIISLIVPKNKKEIFIMTNSGDILKADSVGSPFLIYEEGILDGSYGYKLFYNDEYGFENKIYANKGGFIELDLGDNPTTSVNEIKNGYNFYLSQNYPNPFNPPTTIEYELGERGIVTLKVYDILGKEIKTLINEEKDAGKYSIQFNAVGLASGIYFYKLTNNGRNIIKSMVLLK